MTTFGGDSPEVLADVMRARSKARRVQGWLAQLLDVAPPDEPEQENEDGESPSSS